MTWPEVQNSGLIERMRAIGDPQIRNLSPQPGLIRKPIPGVIPKLLSTLPRRVDFVVCLVRSRANGGCTTLIGCSQGGDIVAPTPFSRGPATKLVTKGRGMFLGPFFHGKVTFGMALVMVI
jgi:hypothetical protein